MFGESGVGWTGDADRQTSGLEHGERFEQVVTAQGVHNEVVAREDLGEILLGVVDDDIGSEVADKLFLGAVGGGGHMGPEVLGKLDDGGSQPPGAGVDENFLPGLDVCPLDQDLPGGQRDQRDRCGLLQRQGGRLERDVIFVDGDVLGEGPDAKVAGACKHLVADREAADVRADLADHTGNVVAEHEGCLVLQELFELAVADHAVQRVDTRRAHPDENVTVTDLGSGTSAARTSFLPYRATTNAFMWSFPFNGVRPHLATTR